MILKLLGVMGLYLFIGAVLIVLTVLSWFGLTGSLGFEQMLAVLGGYAILGVVGMVALALAVYWLFRSLVPKLAGVFAELNRHAGFTALLTLRQMSPTDASPLKTDPRVKTWCADLEAAGFVPAGDFSTFELPDVEIRGFVQPVKGLCAAILVTPSFNNEPRCEIFCTLGSGTRLSVANAPGPSDGNRPSNETRFIEPGASVARMMELIEPILRADPAQGLTPALFAHQFEAEHWRLSVWRHARGFVSAREVVARLEPGQSVAQERLEELVALGNTAWLASWLRLRESMAERYRIAEQLPKDREWQDRLERLVLVHEHQTAEELWQQIEERVQDVLASGPASNPALDFEETLPPDAHPIGGPEFESVRARALQAPDGAAAFEIVAQAMPGPVTSICTFDHPFQAHLYELRGLIAAEIPNAQEPTEDTVPDQRV